MSSAPVVKVIRRGHGRLRRWFFMTMMTVASIIVVLFLIGLFAPEESDGETPKESESERGSDGLFPLPHS